MSIFIIAEIGINHNGDLKIAKELIDIASEAGANAVKFQKRTIDLVYKEDFLNRWSGLSGSSPISLSTCSVASSNWPSSR